MFFGFCLLELRGFFFKTSFRMNSEKYNKQTLIDYLLGAMSETEAEKFDKLSIVGDDFADALQSAENDLIDAYIHGELVNPQLERFKAKYLASPLRRENIEFAQSLQIVTEKNVVKNSQVAEKQTWADFFAAWNIFANFNSALRLGLAALLLAMFGIFGWFLVKNFNKPIEEAKVSPIPTPIITPTIQPINANQTTPSPTNSPTNVNTEKTPEPRVTPKPTVEPTAMPNIPSLVTFVLLLPKRDGGQVQTISIPAKTTDVAFALPLESDDFKTYRAVLTNQSGVSLWQSGKLNSRKNALNVRFPAKLLQSDIYSFIVSGISEKGEAENIGNYSFRTVLR